MQIIPHTVLFLPTIIIILQRPSDALPRRARDVHAVSLAINARACTRVPRAPTRPPPTPRRSPIESLPDHFDRNDDHDDDDDGDEDDENDVGNKK